MEAGMQYADFSSEWSEVATLEQALAVLRSIDIAKEDKLLQSLEAKAQECCPWSFRVTPEGKNAIHFRACRESIEDDTYSVLYSKNYLERQFDGLSYDDVELYLKGYFEAPEAIFA